MTLGVVLVSWWSSLTDAVVMPAGGVVDGSGRWVRLLVGTPQLMARALVIPVVIRSRYRQWFLATLYAQWRDRSVTLTYDAQGGVGEPGDQSGDAGSDERCRQRFPAQMGTRLLVGTPAAADGSGTGYSGGDRSRCRQVVPWHVVCPMADQFGHVDV